jgi:hypothetical protein
MFCDNYAQGYLFVQSHEDGEGSTLLCIRKSQRYGKRRNYIHQNVTIGVNHHQTNKSNGSLEALSHRRLSLRLLLL